MNLGSDGMDVVATISAVSAALGLAKEIREIDAQFDKAELRLKIADLTISLSEAKLGLQDVAEQIREKDAEISRLSKLLEFREAKLSDQGEFRYFANEEGGPKGFPICPRCEKKGDFHSLVQDRSKGAGSATYVCPTCKANFGQHVKYFSPQG